MQFYGSATLRRIELQKEDGLDHIGFNQVGWLGSFGSHLDGTGAVLMDDVKALASKLLLVKLGERVEDVAERFRQGDD